MFAALHSERYGTISVSSYAAALLSQAARLLTLQCSHALTVSRSIQRDVAIRGRDVASVIEQYTQQVKPAFDQYVAPSRKHADVIIPWARYTSPKFCYAGLHCKLDMHTPDRPHGNV